MDKVKDINLFVQQNSPDGGFLQSEEWRKFQEAVGRKTYSQAGENISASIIEHSLPLVGKYLYIPRWPSAKIFNFQFSIFNELLNLAMKNNVGWVRIEPENEGILEEIKKNIKQKVAKAPHDMQPREILVMDITKPEEELLARMKQKTRYNIRLAEKKGIEIKIISNSPNYLISNQIPNSPATAGSRQGDDNSQNSNDKNKLDFSAGLGMTSKYIEEFIKLVKITADRDGITPHLDDYYRKMFEVIPSDIIKLYVAEYEGKVLAANIMLFYGNTCTYMHGASSSEHRELMAPYLLQWRAIQEAKRAGCERYDLGGIKTVDNEQGAANNSWAGITKFKTGFAPETRSVEFPGSYDLVIDQMKYFIYNWFHKIKGVIK